MSRTCPGRGVWLGSITSSPVEINPTRGFFATLNGCKSQSHQSANFCGTELCAFGNDQLILRHILANANDILAIGNGFEDFDFVLGRGGICPNRGEPVPAICCVYSTITAASAPLGSIPPVWINAH